MCTARIFIKELENRRRVARQQEVTQLKWVWGLKKQRVPLLEDNGHEQIYLIMLAKQTPHLELWKNAPSPHILTHYYWVEFTESNCILKCFGSQLDFKIKALMFLLVHKWNIKNIYFISTTKEKSRYSSCSLVKVTSQGEKTLQAPKVFFQPFRIIKIIELDLLLMHWSAVILVKVDLILFFFANLSCPVAYEFLSEINKADNIFLFVKI